MEGLTERRSSQPKQESAEIIVIGNELLNGTTLDTNSHWLSRRLTSSGLLVSRKTTIRDELSTISTAFEQAISRGSAWIFALGGLGPTYDDKTLEGLAVALGTPMLIDEEAKRMLKARQRMRAEKLGVAPGRLTNSVLKMVTLPKGSTPFPNSKGSAPGVLISSRGSCIVSLPGVPSEMKAIYAEQIAPIIAKEGARFVTCQDWIEVVGVGESRLASSLARFSRKYPESVYVKSHPSGSVGGKPRLKIQVIASGPRESFAEARKKLEKVSAALRVTVQRLGGEIQRHSV
ncbi:MAG TPA: molybdopterin-binding protein [Nitrososphaerales archaeon]|nr:molybdopterin-binding protein [Nitrososphaerales archaeon]